MLQEGIGSHARLGTCKRVAVLAPSLLHSGTWPRDLAVPAVRLRYTLLLVRFQQGHTRVPWARGLSPLFAMALLTGCSALPPPSPPPPRPQVTVLAVGDILLGRSLGGRMQDSGDYAQPLRNIAGELKQADIAVGNLEGPFCAEPPYPREGMTFRVPPPGIATLTFAGFDVMNLANNHAGDGGDACLAFSRGHLAAAGIASVGAGSNYDEAHAPAVLTRRGVRFAFLGYTYADRNDRPDSKGAVVAGRNPENLRRDVTAALRRADAVMVILHDGAEYTRSVAPVTVQFARAAIDAGAVAVFGHHPHVPQRIEPYRHGWIFYSLGNFVFQQNEPPAVKHALMARLTFYGAQIVKVEALPAVIEFHSQPRPATPVESRAILEPIGVSRPVVFSLLPE